MVVSNPLREALRGQLMLALYRSGRQADALAVYRQTSELLRDELGLEPGRATSKRLERMILEQDSALEVSQVVPAEPSVDRRSACPSLGTETVSVLLTEIVGSTALFERLGHNASDALIARHFALLREAIVATGGAEVKRLGDGVMAAFRSARDATRCAEAMQQAIDLDNRRRGRDSVALRIGIDVGEVAVRDDDCIGHAATVAKGLCERASGSHVLASALVREVAGGEAFEPVEQFELEGLDGRIGACELRWVPLAAEVLLPSALTYRNAGAFVGRESAHHRMREAWARARDGERRVALLSGEPGIGKTRMAAELAREATGHGALVLYGRCDREPLLAYQPFSEALRGYVGVTPPARLRAQLGRTGPELARLAPALALAGISDGGPLGNAPPESERYRLFAAFEEFLAVLCAEAPVMLVLDDLQWADRPTLMLLRALVRSSSLAQLLLLGTYRDVDARHPFTAEVADLRKDDPVVVHVRLDGLGAADVHALIANRSGFEPPAGVSAAVHNATAGNPLFACEVVEHLLETGQLRDGGPPLDPAELDVPDTLRELIAARLAQLSGDAQAALKLAAVLGQRFEFGVLCQLSDLEEDALLDALDDALRARLIRERSGLGGYAFTHALIRSALERDQSALRRARVHARAAAALEGLDDGDVDGRAAEIAAHYQAAGKEVAPEIAVAAHIRAAGVALRRLAFEEAVTHAERALAVPPLQDIELAEATLTLAEAQASSGEDERAADTCERAAELAIALRRVDLLARAALTLSGPTWGRVFDSGGLRRRAVRLLEAALELAGDAESVEIVRVLGRLATELILTEGNTERRRQLIERALAMAESLDSFDARFYAAKERAFYAWGFYEPNVLESAVERLRELGQKRGDRESVMLGLLPTAPMRAGNRDETDECIRRYGELAEVARLPHHLAQSAVLHTGVALMDGPLDEAEALLVAAIPLVERSGDAIVAESLTAQLVQLRLEQDRGGEIIEVLEGAVSTTPEMPAWRGVRALLYARAGRDDDARRELDALAPNRFAAIPRNGVWIEGIRALAETSIALGDARYALTLYELLEPYVERMFVVGNGVICHGSVHGVMGRLISLVGEWARAEEHLECALNVNSAFGARVLVAHTLFHQAELVLSSGAPGDPRLARERVTSARAAARELGLSWLWKRADNLPPSGTERWQTLRA